MSVEHSYSLPPPVLAVKMEHFKHRQHTWRHSAVVTGFKKEREGPDLSQSPQLQPQRIPIAPEEEGTGAVPSTHVRCLLCPVVLYRQNLCLHIQRKHGHAKDITAQSYLPRTSADQSNGLDAVRTASRGFSLPMHVQHETRGQQHLRRWRIVIPSVR